MKDFGDGVLLQLVQFDRQGMVLLIQLLLPAAFAAGAVSDATAPLRVAGEFRRMGTGNALCRWHTRSIGVPLRPGQEELCSLPIGPIFGQAERFAVIQGVDNPAQHARAEVAC